MISPVSYSNRRKAILGLALGAVLLNPLHAQTYQAGDIVEDFSLTDRATGQPVNLYSLEGKIIFLEWFAHWCPFCQAAASQVGPDVVDHFKGAGGNAEGVEVIHVSLNLQSGQETQTQAFIDQYGLGEVWNDFNRMVASRFGTGQPIFAIINGVAGSPSHQQWELVYAQNGYGQTNFPITVFRTQIDSVSAAEIPDEPPAITIPPISISAGPGDPVTFEVSATGDNLLYQWMHDDWICRAAPVSSLMIPSVSPAEAGAYRVRVFNSEGNLTSQTAFLSVVAPGAVPASLANVSTRLSVGTGDRILVAGFFVDGATPGRILVRGIGPTLADFSLIGVLENPLLRLFRGDLEISLNDDWSDLMDPDGVRMIWQRAGAFDLMNGTGDGALFEELDSGLYSAQVTGVDETTGLGLVEVYEVGGDDGGVLTNISTRGRIAGGSDLMIMGFVLQGEAPRTVLVRAVGPTLAEFGVSGVVSDPELKLYGSEVTEPLAENDRWNETREDAMAEAMALVGAFPLNSLSEDSAILIGLPPGAYTAHVSAPETEEGVVLAEVYILPE